ncbi:MAG: TonB-dependent receptor [Halioglobus sp.]
MKQPVQRFTRTVLFSSIAGLIASPAISQVMLEEIVVTANRVESNLMDTAAAISAFDSSAMSEKGIENQRDLSAFTPSLTVAPSRVSIRGIGRTNLALGSDPGVGLYWDGIYNTETDIFGYSNFLDIDRVEVLRGPQGTLYGRNSIGGAVNLISTKPNTEEWGGKLIGQVGNYDYQVLQGLASGPVTEKLSALVALSQIKRDGLQTNVINGDKYDERDNFYGTFALDHQSTERWSNSFKYSNADSDRKVSAGYVLDDYLTDPVQEVFNTSSPFQQLNFVGAFPAQFFANPQQGMTRENPAIDSDGDKVAVDTTPSQTSEREFATFISEYEFDQFTLKYSGGYSEFRFNRLRDLDVSHASDSGLDYSLLPVAGLGGLTVDVFTGFARTPVDMTQTYRQSADTWSHELQLISDLSGRLNFMGGLYYYNSEEEQYQDAVEHNEELIANYTFLGSVIGGGLPTNQDGFLYRGEGFLETTSYAAYGQMYWDWSDSTKFTLGLRYSSDEKEAEDNTFVQWLIPDDPASETDPTVYRKDKDDWSKVTWRIGVDHMLSDDHFLYGFIASGYRSGGFNLLSPLATDELTTVDPEELISFELGYKGTMLDQRLTLTTAAYYYDYSDLQINKADVVNGATVSTFENAADANAYGVEAEVMALLTDGLILSATYSYNKTEYEEYDSADTNACAIGPLRVGDAADPLCTSTQDLKGNEFPLSPEHKASASLTYAWELVNLDWSTTLSYIYNGEQQLSAFNNPQYDELDDYDRWDARFNLASLDQTWEATAFVQNISDERQEVFRGRPNSVSGLSSSNLSDPRTYGIKLSYNF